MAHQVRRVVTGHDANGKAIVKIDEIVTNIMTGRLGAQAHAIWTTEKFPVDNDGQDDNALRKVGTTLTGGTIFRVVEFSPGVASRNHRTDSIDYAVVIKGEIDMDIDGAMVHLKAGNVMVQRGTIHNWINNGQRVLHHRLHPDRRQTGDRRGKGPQRCGLIGNRWNQHRGCSVISSFASGSGRRDTRDDHEPHGKPWTSRSDRLRTVGARSSSLASLSASHWPISRWRSLGWRSPRSIPARPRSGPPRASPSRPCCCGATGSGRRSSWPPSWSNLTNAGSLATSAAIATGNTLECVIAGFLVNLWSGGRETFATPTRIALFALICLLPTALSATMGVWSLTLAGYAQAASFPSIWLTWWVGDLAGAMVVAPVVVLWARPANQDVHTGPE